MDFALTKAQEAGLIAETGEYNRRNDSEWTPEQFLTIVFETQLTAWANRVLSLPAFAFIQRFTPAEYAATMQLAETVPDIKAYIDKLAANPTVNLGHEDVLQGVPLVFAALQEIGVIKDGTARAAEVLAP